MEKDLIQPIVTVLMPVFNAEKHLKKAIESILSQSFKEFEFLIINDGSSDKSKTIIANYNDPRIRLINHKTNKKLIYTLNEGLKASNGKYVARMDSDDISALNRLEIQVAFMEEHPEIAVCGSWAKAIDNQDNFLFAMNSPTGLLLKYNYWKPAPVIHPSVIIRKNSIGEEEFDSQYPHAEDYEFWLRLIKNGCKFYNIPEYLLSYRMHPGSISKTNQQTQRESSMAAFQTALRFPNIDLSEYLSLCALEYKAGFWHRFSLLVKLSKKISYPFWFMLLDNCYYQFRKTLFYYLPKLKKY